MTRKKCKDPPKLPELCGANLLGRICLHPSKSSRIKCFRPNSVDKTGKFEELIVTEVTAQPPSYIRLREEARGRKGNLLDRFSSFLSSHPGDRPWRRVEGDLPLWDPREALANKAAILTAKIASDFCAWYRGLGGDPVIDEDTVQQMFAIHFPEPARGGTRVLLSELKHHDVPKIVLDKLGLPQFPFPKPAEQQQLTKVAFGRCVPRTENSIRPAPSRVPPLPRPPEGLLAMQPVFEDITQLNITRGLCQVLNETCDMPRPAYLVNKGLISRSVQQEQQTNVEKKRESILQEPPWDVLQ